MYYYFIFILRHKKCEILYALVLISILLLDLFNRIHGNLGLHSIFLINVYAFFKKNIVITVQLKKKYFLKFH